jgi:uncharacterized protein YecE (DUF72 family)
MRAQTIRIGTSGYAYPDWKEFYPKGLPVERYLEHYAGQFPSVELNFSYYRLPTYSQLKNLTAYVPETFTFFIKAYKTLTHFITEQPSPEQLREDSRRFREAVDGLGPYLKGVLFQFPYGFHYTPENLETIGRIIEPMRNPVIEFRHKSWLTYSVSDFLKAHRIPYCAVDEPALPNLIPPIVRAFGNTGYVRFHGRNKTHWYGDSKLRYDYEYSEDELLEWVEKIDYLSEYSDETFIFFNNCHQGKAAKNAKMMADILGVE